MKTDFVVDNNLDVIGHILKITGGTNKELADTIGCDEKTLTSARNYGNVRKNTLHAIAEYLCVPVAAIYNSDTQLCYLIAQNQKEHYTNRDKEIYETYQKMVHRKFYCVKDKEHVNRGYTGVFSNGLHRLDTDYTVVYPVRVANVVVLMRYDSKSLSEYYRKLRQAKCPVAFVKSKNEFESYYAWGTHALVSNSIVNEFMDFLAEKGITVIRK